MKTVTSSLPPVKASGGRVSRRHQITLVLPEAWALKLDEIALARSTPGAVVNRAEVAREALSMGMAALPEMKAVAR